MKTRALTLDEVARVINQLDGPQNKALFTLGVNTGFRISELLSLTYKDVLNSDGTVKSSITLNKARMKGEVASRTLPLNPQARKAIKGLLARLNTNGKLFSISRVQAHRLIKKAANKAGLEGVISTHSMRKTFGTRIYEMSEKDIVLTQRALGHVNINSTIHYLDVDKKKVDRLILDL